MEALIILLFLYLFAALVVFPIWAMIKIAGLDRRHESAEARVRTLEIELDALKSARPSSALRPEPGTTVVSAPLAELPPSLSATVVPAATAVPAPASVITPPAATPPTPPSAPTPIAAREEDAPPVIASAPPPVTPAPPPPPSPAPRRTDSINWEQFMGAKLFAWLGGLALFLGVAFFVKYSFDHGWIPAEVRVALGFVFGAALIVGGLRLNRARYAVTAQTLIATGVVSLYAVTFAANAIYHFAFFGQIPTFLVMALITATAFVLSVRLRAQIVALLGLLGGFLTPILLSTGVDNPAGLFGYLALLDLGLIAVALRTGWVHLVPLSAVSTVMMMVGWTDRFFTAEKGPVAMTIALAFGALYGIATEFARRRGRSETPLTLSAVGMALVGLGFALFFLAYPAFAARAPLYFGYVLLLDLLLLRIAWQHERLPRLALFAGLAVHAILALWTAGHLTDDLLPWALAAYLGFGSLHTVCPYALQRRYPESAATGWGQLFPPLALLLIMLPLAKLDSVSLLVWPAILLIDALAIGLAFLIGSLVTVACVMVLTLVATGLCLFKVPMATVLEPSLLLILGGFAVFFFAASTWLVRRLGDRLGATAAHPVFGDARAQLPAFSALLPFLLLILVCLRLDVPDPSMVFGLALLLVVLVLGIARLLVLEWLPLCALVGVAALQFAWTSRHFDPAGSGVALAWHGLFYALFTLFPLLFRTRFARQTGPWMTSAVAGIVHFLLFYRAINLAMPNPAMGLLPAAFALPPLLSLVVVLRTIPAGEPKLLNQLAWLGGVALLFITLIFPIQFDRQWLTLAWALEGLALIWLFHRVPHPGLRATGVALLIAAFVRLAFNTAVFSYHVRGELPILNWYLATYGLAIAALFVSARLLAPPRERTLGLNAPAVLNTLGVILAFILLNIEIADYFTAPGAHSLRFRFSGHFGRDMTYTIAWSLFALGLLVVGLWRQLQAARYAAIALLCVALAKLFFHDLTQLSALYRIGALFGVAVIAIVASLVYQRFLPSHEKTPPAIR